VTLVGSVVATRCAFCGAASVVIAEQSEELVEPGGVAPFVFGEAEARKFANAYLAEQRFKPDDLDDLAMFEAIRPIYLPFWTFDMNGTITYQGFTVEYEYKRVRLVPTEGTMEAMYDDVIVPATRSLSSERLGGLKFDTSHLTPYSPDLLANWPAEVYSVSLSDAAVIAHDKAHRETSERIKHGLDPAVAELKDVTIKDVVMSIASYKHVLLPVWITRYTYRGQSYDLLVNGQSGQAHGDVPRKGLQKVLGSLFGGEA
jgi:hypothetical protein